MKHQVHLNDALARKVRYRTPIYLIIQEKIRNTRVHKNMEIKIVKVNSANKKNYKNKSISTFPQVYLVNNNNELLIGGYNELKNIYDIINSSSNLQHIIKKMNTVLSNKFSRKDKLRLTQMLNHKLN